MSTSTYIHYYNSKDPEFLAAVNGSPEAMQEWEDSNGLISDRPGKLLEDQDDGITATDDEYGGWIIDLSAVPKDATHVVISRF